MRVFPLFLILISVASLNAREIREFTNREGKTIEGELIRFEDGIVRLRVSGRVFDIPADALSEQDQAWLAEQSGSSGTGENEGEYTETIFEDDFSGEGFKEGWGHYKSESIVAEGVLTGKTIDINDHAGVDSVRFEGRQDMEVSVRFRFAGPSAQRFNVWFDDKDLKESHAGHVCNVIVSPTELQIQDAKTGSMRLDIREKRQAGEQLDEETLAMLAKKAAKFALELEGEKEEWHQLLIRTKGDSATVWIDGEEIGSLQSEGIAHPTKSLVSLTTYEDDVQYDDFVVKAAPSAGD